MFAEKARYYRSKAGDQGQAAALATGDVLRCDAPELRTDTDDNDVDDIEFSVKDEESIVSDTDYIPPSERGSFHMDPPKNSNLTVKVTRFAAAEEGILPFISYLLL